MNWVTIKKFCESSGYSEKAIRRKIERGIWEPGTHYVKAPDGRIQISIEAVEAWIQGLAA